MIDISSLPEHEFTGLEGFEAKELYKVVRNAWSNHVEAGSAVSGVFLDYETARSFIKAMADREERLAKEDNEVFDYEIFWDQLDGFNIITYMEYGDELRFYYAIKKVPLWYKP